jgi:hypothetical protein
MLALAAKGEIERVLGVAYGFGHFFLHNDAEVLADAQRDNLNAAS